MVNKFKKQIILCRSFVEDLWGGNISQPTTRFDNCGMTTYWLDKPNDTDVILPSLKFKNAGEFLAQVKPPLYEDYEIQIVGDDDYLDCFKKAII